VPSSSQPDRARATLDREQDVRDDLGDLTPLDLLAHGRSPVSDRVDPAAAGALGGDHDLVI
jgi:hypothetical protein